MLTDIGLPSMSGLDVLAHARALPNPPLVIVMTSDDTPETLLQAVKRQAYRYVRKPFAPKTVVEVIEDALASASTSALPFEVISAKPEWLEILAPCSLEMADRVHSFVMHLEADLPATIRESVALAFRELLNNAVEWGGKLDPTRQVRISASAATDAHLPDLRSWRRLRHRSPSVTPRRRTHRGSDATHGCARGPGPTAPAATAWR
jgi:hypothetical protein